MSKLSPQYQLIQDKIDALNVDKATFEENLQVVIDTGSPDQKKYIIGKINAVQNQIDQEEAQFAACVANFPVLLGMFGTPVEDPTS